MRDLILDYINGINLGGFLLSQELPWSESGTPLYIKNPKRIYVDIAEFSSEPLVVALNGLHISQEVITVRVYFSADAKQIPPNYEQTVQDLRGAKDITTISGPYRRECIVNTTYENDMLVSTLEFRFTKLLP